MDGSVSFNSTSLQTFNRTNQTGIVTNKIDIESLADKVLTTYALAHNDASTIADISTPQRIIPLSGSIAGSSVADLDARLDAFRGVFRGKDKYLDILYGGRTRRWTGTAYGLSITRWDNNKVADWSVQILCTQPFGIDTLSQYILNIGGRTASAYNDSYTFLGTAPFQLPVITLILSAVSSSGSQSLTWGNGDNGQSITITRNNWASGDIVTIDTSNPLNQRVQVNGIDTDFTGAFPEFTPETHNLSYSDTFTSRTLGEIVYYNVRYA